MRHSFKVPAKLPKSLGVLARGVQRQTQIHLPLRFRWCFRRFLPVNTLRFGEPPLTHGLSALLREILRQQNQGNQHHGFTVRFTGTFLITLPPISTSATVALPRPKCSGPA